MAALAIAAPAGAQDRTEDVKAAIAQLQAAGVELHGACGAARITNLVAWNLRPAYGLLKKAGGFRAVLRPDGTCDSGGGEGDTTREVGVASDYLIDRASFVGYDLLADAGGDNGAHWQGPETDPGLVNRNRLNVADPIDPSAYMHPAGVVIPPPVSPSGAPPASVVVVPSAVEGILVAKVDTLAARVEQLYALEAEQSRAAAEAFASINQNVTDGRAEARPAIETVKAIGGFAAKYVLPAVGGWLTAKHFQ